MMVVPHFVCWYLGLAQPETQTTRSERDCLVTFALGKKLLAELGVWHAVTTCQLRAAMAPDAVLVAIDPFPVGRLGFSAQHVIAKTELESIHNGVVHWMRCVAVEAAHRAATAFKDRFDFVFVDGDHTYQGLKDDWNAWSPLVAAGGIIALHDSHSSSTRNIDDAGSVAFTREVILKDPRFRLVDVVETLSVLQRQ